MRRLPVFLLALAALEVPAVSWAVSTTGNLAITVTAPSPPPSGSCPQGTSYPDGCSAAPAGTPQLPNLFSAPFAPHTKAYAVRPPWNVAGVDYHVGCSAPTCTGGSSSGTPLKDPTAAGNRPAGLSYNSSTKIATVTGNNTTVTGFDFCTPGVSLQIATSVVGTVVSENKFCAAASAPNNNGSNIMFVIGGASDITFTKNEIDGKSPTHSGSGFNVEAAFKTYGDGSALVEYNYMHDVDNKMWRFEGSYSCTNCVTFKYNYDVNVGMYSGTSGDHSEEVFNGCDCDFNGRVIAYNTSISQMWNVAGLGAITANYNIGNPVAGITLTINNDSFSNNVVINEGTNGPGGGNAQIAGENLQVGCNNGDSCNNNQIMNNYIDTTGGYYPFYPLTVPPWPSQITFSNVSENINLVSGNSCNPRSWYITGGGAGTGTCN